MREGERERESEREREAQMKGSKGGGCGAIVSKRASGSATHSPSVVAVLNISSLLLATEAKPRPHVRWQLMRSLREDRDLVRPFSFWCNAKSDGFSAQYAQQKGTRTMYVPRARGKPELSDGLSSILAVHSKTSSYNDNLHTYIRAVGYVGISF